jgi:hypothetical protein
MLALCFLILNKIEQEELWARWIGGHTDDIKIIIHSKEPCTFKTNLFKEHSTIIETIPTRWGDFSLVKATMLLFEEAIKNPDVSHCILLSGACIPVKPFEFVKEQLLANKSYATEELRFSDSRYILPNNRIQNLFK